MATTRRAREARPAASHDGPDDARVSALFAGCGLALVAARHVVPAESAHLGETLWIAAAWLLLATAWLLLRQRGFAPRLRFDRGDLAVALLVGGHVAAAGGVLALGGHRRAALNMLWEWGAVGVAVVLLRNWLTQSARWPALWRLIAAAGVVLAGLGVWQFSVTYPALRAQLRALEELEHRQSQAALTPADADRFQPLRRELGRLATETDPNVRYALRQRILDSTEPLACFALANTLSGVLAVALLLLLGALCAAIAAREGMASALRIAGPAVLVAICLVFTKSRTAWIGSFVGLIAWGLAAARSGFTRRGIGMALAGLLAAAALAGIAWSAGALDRLVLLETLKSFRYRLEYWTGSWGVIRDHLWLGVGPGNFRQHYLRHKVAGSSEEILDPHNMLLDVWANGGVLALAGLLLAGVVALLHWRRSAVAVTPAEREPPTADEHAEQDAVRRSVMLSGGAGIGLVLLKSGLIDAHWDARLAALLAAWTVAALLLPPLRIGPLSIMAAGIALGVHLLGAGGIAMPVVVTTLLLLWLGPVALPEDAAEESEADATRHRRRAFAGFLLFAALTPACLFSGVVPVTLASLYVDAATGAMAERGDAATARRYLLDAAAADALDPEPRILLAQLEHDQVQVRPGAGSNQWMTAIAQLAPAILLDPENPKTHWLDAQWRLEFVLRFPNENLAQAALESAQRAAERDPQHAGIVATLAEACAAAGQPDAARDAAQRALALDSLNLELGHFDKLLGDTRRAALQGITDD